jgi:hypothetical protein
MVRSFCARGNHETPKSGVHGAVAGLVAVCALYNLTAWYFRRDRHLGLNAVIYSMAVVWELKHTARHLSACAPTPAPAFALVETKAA